MTPGTGAGPAGPGAGPASPCGPLVGSDPHALAEHLQLALSAGGLGTWRWDLATSRVIWDERLEALFGLAPGTFGGTYDDWMALLHPDDVEHVLATVRGAMEARSGYVMDHRVVWPDGSVRWLQGRGQVVVDDRGEVAGTIGCVGDVTERVVAEQERDRLVIETRAAAASERLHRERLEFLARINDELRFSVDRADLMQRVTRVAVPRLGDWCSIHVTVEDADVPLVEVAHVEPDMVAFARSLQDRFPYDPDALMGVPAVIRSGQTEFHPRIDDQLIEAADVPTEAREVLRSLALQSAIVVPLRKRERILGAMQFVATAGSRPYDLDDVTLAEAVAVRIASSLENLRLVEQSRRVAATLQRTLLPRVLPEMPGVEVAVRYWAAGEGADVGGDFYDVFALDDDRWGVAIGDVCGTGPTAASVTGLARHTIRAAAWHGDGPAEVLSRLNRALLASELDTFVTALHGELDPTAHRIGLAVAGHPLPVLVVPDGAGGRTGRLVGRPGTLLGAYDEPRLHEVEVDLPPGSVLVLYTDGVTDVAPPFGLDEAALVELVTEAAAPDRSADEVADRIDAAISGIRAIAARADDIALLVLRATG
ncbi:MAG: SpoIIE family protein phosphatase [Acidimicrobiales bacterium]